MRLFLFFLVVALPCSAHIKVTAKRVYFDQRMSHGYLVVTNPNAYDIAFSTRLVDKVMTSEGNILDAEGDAAPVNSLKPYLRYSPRSGVLKAGQDQTIRFMVRRKAQMQSGEYQSFLKVFGAPNNVDSGALAARVAFNLPVIYRYGETQVTSELQSPKLIDNGSTRALQIIQTREGNRSLYGDFVVTGRFGNEIGRLNGEAVYVPLSSKSIQIPLSEKPAGPLTVTYKEDPGYGGNLTSVLNITL